LKDRARHVFCVAKIEMIVLALLDSAFSVTDHFAFELRRSTRVSRFSMGGVSSEMYGISQSDSN